MRSAVIPLSDRPDLKAEVDRLHEHAWPRFVLDGHSPDGALKLWYPLLEQFADYQLLLFDDRDQLIAAGHTIPVIWDGTVAGLPAGWSGTLLDGFAIRQQDRRPTTLAALGIAVLPSRRGQGIAVAMLQAMKSLAAQNKLNALIAPVRPSHKDRYPLTPMQRYVQWTRKDSEPFDPWIRTHWKIGARPLAVAERSMIITGTVREWEQWTQMALPESGQYVIPGALVPVRIDCEKDLGLYEEPNYWMRHPLP